MRKIHHKIIRNAPRPKRFKNLPGGPQRKFSLYKRFYYFLLRLFHLPLLSTLPENLIIPSAEARKRYDSFEQADTLTWLGHSTFLIKLNGKTILTDPFLTDYASPFAHIGPKRYTPPGICIQDLPPIDIILVSHDHYDHCDARTLVQLPNKENIDVIVPLGLGYLFEELGYRKIQQLNWHESCSLHDIIIRALPAYHYSKRHLLNRNTSLWAGYALITSACNLYFSGDTAYGAVFTELGNTYGPFDYALVSIGAYEPAYFMLASHLSPEQAVQVGKDLQAETLVAMHWGTIVLSDEPHLEPPLRFHHAAQEANYAYHDIWVLSIGETKKL
jgi:N-acyl-phosphatidylethanolamine-hydrolysing phospholipase D